MILLLLAADKEGAIKSRKQILTMVHYVVSRSLICTFSSGGGWEVVARQACSYSKHHTCIGKLDKRTSTLHLGSVYCECRSLIITKI